MYSLICARINGWVNSWEAGDLRRHYADYDVTVMSIKYLVTEVMDSFICHKITWSLMTCQHKSQCSKTMVFVSGKIQSFAEIDLVFYPLLNVGVAVVRLSSWRCRLGRTFCHFCEGKGNCDAEYIPPFMLVDTYGLSRIVKLGHWLAERVKLGEVVRCIYA